MPKIFTTLDKIKPAYDVTYKVVLFICKILLIVDILITTMSVVGRYVPFIPDPAWSEEVVLTCMSYMAVLSAALAIRRGASTHAGRKRLCRRQRCGAVQFQPRFAQTV